MNIFQKELFCAIGNSNKDESDIQEPSSETKFSAKELSTILCEKPKSRTGVLKKSLFPKKSNSEEEIHNDQNEKFFQCSTCNYRCSVKRSLTRHVTSVH